MLVSQLFTPEEMVRDLRWHELTREEQEMLRRALAAELGHADQRVKDALRARVNAVYTLIRPPGAQTSP